MRLSERVILTLSGDSGCSLSHRSDANCYAVCCGPQVWLVDAGVGVETEVLLRSLAAAGVATSQIAGLLLTHGHLDHSGGAFWIHENLGVPVFASHETARALETGDEEAICLSAAKQAGIYDAAMKFRACPVAHKLAGDETWRAGDVTIRAMRTPGHSDDMMSFLFETPTGLLAFPGDTVFHGGRIAMQNIPDCRPAEYARSLRALAALPIDGFFPGHGIWSLQRGAAQIRASLQHLDRLLLPPNAF